MTTYMLLGTRGRTMVPIETDALEIGTRVRQARHGKIGTICEKGTHGYTVIFDDGESHDAQQLDCLSPFTRITVVDEPPAKLTDVLWLKQQRDRKRAADRLAGEEASRQHAIDYEKAKEELRTKYPWAIPLGGKISEHARAAKNMKKELALVWPGVKFSTRSDSFSGGDSVDVSWTDGPTRAQVDEIIGKYQEGHFNGMEDIYEYNRSAFSDAVSHVLGQAKFVSGQRSYSDALVQKAIDRIVKKYKLDVAALDITPARYHTGQLRGVTVFSKQEWDPHWDVQSQITQEASRIGMMPKQGA